MNAPILLMTRAQEASEHFVRRLDPNVLKGITILYAPLLKIVPTQNTIELAQYNAVIFSSVNGVLFAPQGSGRDAYCVGARTTDAALARGWQVKGTAQDAHALVALLLKTEPVGAMLHIAGEHRRGKIAEKLTAAGYQTDVHTTYRQPLVPFRAEVKEAIAGEGAVIVPLFSPRVAAQFASQIADYGSLLHVLAMSPAVKEALKGACVGKVQIASAPTGDEMRRGVEILLCDNSLP